MAPLSEIGRQVPGREPDKGVRRRAGSSMQASSTPPTQGHHDDVGDSGGAGLATAIADSRARASKTSTRGVEQVTRSMATNKAQVGSSTVDPAC